MNILKTWTKHNAPNKKDILWFSNTKGSLGEEKRKNGKSIVNESNVVSFLDQHT